MRRLVVVAILTDVVDSLEEELSRESLYAFCRQVLMKNDRAQIGIPLPQRSDPVRRPWVDLCGSSREA